MFAKAKDYTETSSGHKAFVSFTPPLPRSLDFISCLAYFKHFPIRCPTTDLYYWRARGGEAFISLRTTFPSGQPSRRGCGERQTWREPLYKWQHPGVQIDKFALNSLQDKAASDYYWWLNYTSMVGVILIMKVSWMPMAGLGINSMRAPFPFCLVSGLPGGIWLAATGYRLLWLHKPCSESAGHHCDQRASSSVSPDA